MPLCDDGPAVVKAILLEIERGYRVLPSQITLKALEKATGVRPQNIGMAFEDHIKIPLKYKGISAKKRGTAGKMIIALAKI